MRWITLTLIALVLLMSCQSDQASEKEPPSSEKKIEKGAFSTTSNNTKSKPGDETKADEKSLEDEVNTTPELELFLFEKNGLYGYKNAENAVVLEAKYQMAHDFVNGMAEVVDEEGWAYINGKGEVLARPFVYDNGPDYFQEGLARFVEQGKVGFLDEKGKQQIKAEFDFARPFSGGLAAACMGCEEKQVVTESGSHTQVVGGKWGFIDNKGQWQIPCEYEAVRDFEDGVGAYQKDGQWVKIDAKGIKL